MLRNTTQVPTWSSSGCPTVTVSTHACISGMPRRRSWFHTGWFAPAAASAHEYDHPILPVYGQLTPTLKSHGAVKSRHAASRRPDW